ncbi:sugar transferase [Halobacteriovorax sp. ZH1_bin.1]|uniref:sugar transferase n=1 Tax=Halobacteriovorax sp. ZH1_bin.1 TaxID=3157723 RepID=UPI00371BF07B
MKIVKRVLDLIFAIIGLIVFLPVMLIVFLALLFSLKKYPIFKQKRPGLDQKIFCIYKFKTMLDTLDEEGNLLPDNERITKVGKIIRKLSLDELPQLFNVLKGQLSLVGPRPLLVQYLEIYTDEEKRRHSVVPGITGWAQVNGRNAITWKKKFELDLYYVDNWSLFLDFKILFLTFYKVIGAKDIQSSENVTMEPYDGTN